jgi:molybdate transport system permease protein
MVELSPLWLSAKLAFITTTILFIIAIPLCYWLSKTKSNIKIIIEALISLPLVLPPSVLGLYLLIAFSPNHFFGQFIEKYLNLNLLFSFEGLVVCSVFYSLPFMINPILSGFKSLPLSLEEASYILGKSKTKTIIKILLPNIKPAIITGIVMSFAHTLGEFGVVLMVGGNIPNETKVVSLAIYDEVQAMNYSNANLYAIMLLGFSFITLIITYWINKKNALI